MAKLLLASLLEEVEAGARDVLEEVDGTDVCDEDVIMAAPVGPALVRFALMVLVEFALFIMCISMSPSNSHTSTYRMAEDVTPDGTAVVFKVTPTVLQTPEPYAAAAERSAVEQV